MHQRLSSFSSIAFDNSYARLPERFFARLAPEPVARPELVALNHALAESLGLDAAYLSSDVGVAALAGNAVPPGAEPVAMAYAGHQFGGWVPRLGDGRAILLGEVVDRAGRRMDLHLKGSGRTPYSRNGDGRAWLGPVLREYVVSEAMAALGVPTTRALAAVATNEPVFREDILPGAVLTRVARAHVRVGTFEYFAGRGDADGVRILADYVIDRLYPQARDAANPYLSLLTEVVAAQADLIAKWMGVGFIHGVMNTDNMSVAGETIDYGPCAFMDSYHPDTVFSSIDHFGRYAYDAQPRMALWNLTRLASVLLPLLDAEPARAEALAHTVLEAFPDLYSTAWSAIFRAKLGLARERDGDIALIQELLAAMTADGADFTETFRALCDAIEDGGGPSGPAYAPWLARWRARLSIENTPADAVRARMRAANPAFIPRNHRIEEMIRAAVNGDFEPFERLSAVLARPFDDQPEHADLRVAPKPHEVVRATFCGT
ncbi:MAG: YdiU family protein [Alphaproteobacteria bacterium]|nr:YdiU family protein [Alphaproteobacteria bacterium]